MIDLPVTALPATAVILAGGRSSRMGRDKAALTVKGKSLLCHVIDGLTDLFEAVIVAGPPDRGYERHGVTVVPDRRPGLGPLAGLEAGLAASAHPWIFLTACDMPRPNSALIRFLFAQAPGRSLIVPRGPDGIEPLFAFYHRDVLTVVRESLDAGRLSIHQLPRTLGAVPLPFSTFRHIDPEALSFGNINVPEDLGENAAHGATGAEPKKPYGNCPVIQ